MAFNVFGSTFEVKKELLSAAAKEAFLYLGGDFEVNLRFVSQKRIRELNKTFRNRDIATDVLSFKLDPNVSGGDIAICYKEVQRQAKNLHINVSENAAFLLVHGILHLAGFEHTKTEDRAKMEKAEEEILKKIGVKIGR